MHFTQTVRPPGCQPVWRHYRSPLRGTLLAQLWFTAALPNTLALSQSKARAQKAHMHVECAAGCGVRHCIACAWWLPGIKLGACHTAGTDAAGAANAAAVLRISHSRTRATASCSVSSSGVTRCNASASANLGFQATQGARVSARACASISLAAACALTCAHVSISNRSVFALAAGSCCTSVLQSSGDSPAATQLGSSLRRSRDNHHHSGS